jgi:hypothetical protein
MRTKHRMFVLLVLGFGFGLNYQSFPQQTTQRHRIGRIVEIQGTVYLKPSSNAKAKKLDPVRDRKRALYAGELVRCEEGGFLKVLINRIEDTIKPSNDWREFVAKARSDVSPGIIRKAQGDNGVTSEGDVAEGKHQPRQDAEAKREAASPTRSQQHEPAASASIEPATNAKNLPGPSVRVILQSYADASVRRPAVGATFSDMEKIKGGVRPSLYFGSTEARGTFAIPSRGSNLSMELFTKGYDRALAVVEFPGAGAIKEGLNGKSAWRQTPGFGTTDINPSQSWFVRLSPVSYSASRLMNEYHDWVIMYSTTVGDRFAYVLQGTPTEGSPEKFYFDTRNSLLLRVDSPVSTTRGEFIFERYFEDYRDVDGVKIPFGIHGTAPTGSFTFKLNEFKRNVAIADSKFEKPKPQ